ncbi:AAA family ATPase [Thermonema rossianum]|uniref:AAA family ATPase n=1 Tax=Thermonema rossianum TaxID=55505 RepID=UPI000570398D|nr:AAA family ATPase [Thermonema rossianum]
MTSKKLDKNYKLRDLRCYASRNALMGNQYEYRRVFEASEVNYLYAELSFFNKLFDEEDWACDCVLKAYRIKNNEKIELCSIDIHREVRKEENIVYVREGWGTPEYGAFWKRGDYLWEAFIDGELVASQKIYVEEGGKVTPGNNPYFDIESLRFFNGPYSLDDLAGGKRRYLTQFASDKTQYIWTELTLRNKQTRSWYCEIFFNYFDDAGQLKGSVSDLLYVAPGTTTFYSLAGWGNNTPGSWLPDNYRVEIVFMSELVAVAPLRVHETVEVEGEPEVFFPAENKPYIAGGTAAEASMDEKSLEELLQELNEMIGLEPVKKRLNDFIHYLKFLRLRQAQGFEENTHISLHSAFLGNPGTGKTTVAKMLGKIYHKMGLLSKGTVHEVSRADLVGKFIGQTAPQTQEAINKARGGILFIDEAYALARKGDEGGQDFGKEAIEILIKEMSDGPGDLAIIMAGYPEEMQHMLQSNPGMKSRINLIYHFPDYTPQELMEILELKARKKGVVFAPEAKEYIYKQLVELYRNRDRTFGNARLVTSLVEEAKLNMGLRIMQQANAKELSKEALETILLEDVKAIFGKQHAKKPDIPIDEELLHDAMQQLNALIGMENVKNEIHELVKLVRFYRESGRDVLNRFSMHMVFTGNPGTGKTTVARIIAQVYKALGILERGHLVECDRQSLVAAYVGQTAIKTKQKIDEAIGGVLFIDEAYALTSKSEQDFGKEAVEVLLKQMEDRRGEFVVIVAGYPDNMHEFLHANPGLLSRFDMTIHFDDYKVDELYDIALSMFEQEGLHLDLAAQQQLRSYLEHLYRTRNKYFGNARSVRKVVQQAVRHQHLRMASLPKEARTPEVLETVTIEDLRDLMTSSNDKEEGLGFRLSGGGA